MTLQRCDHTDTCEAKLCKHHGPHECNDWRESGFDCTPGENITTVHCRKIEEPAPSPDWTELGPEMAAMLKRLEWDNVGGNMVRCNVCGKEQAMDHFRPVYPHAPDCALANLLSRAEG